MVLLLLRRTRSAIVLVVVIVIMLSIRVLLRITKMNHSTGIHNLATGIGMVDNVLIHLQCLTHCRHRSNHKSINNQGSLLIRHQSPLLFPMLPLRHRPYHLRHHNLLCWITSYRPIASLRSANKVANTVIIVEVRCRARVRRKVVAARVHPLVGSLGSFPVPVFRGINRNKDSLCTNGKRAVAVILWKEAFLYPLPYAALVVVIAFGVLKAMTTLSSTLQPPRVRVMLVGGTSVSIVTRMAVAAPVVPLWKPLWSHCWLPRKRFKRAPHPRPAPKQQETKALAITVM